MLEYITWKLAANIPFHAIDFHAYISHIEKTTPILVKKVYFNKFFRPVKNIEGYEVPLSVADYHTYDQISNY